MSPTQAVTASDLATSAPDASFSFHVRFVGKNS